VSYGFNKHECALKDYPALRSLLLYPATKSRVYGAAKPSLLPNGDWEMKRFTDSELRHLRNEILVRGVIEILLQIPTKEVEGVYRFLCPTCYEFQTGLNLHINLARCFHCESNFNPMELLMADRGLSFSQSANLLLQKEPLLKKAPQYQPVEFEAGCSTPAQILHQQFYHLNNPYSAD